MPRSVHIGTLKEQSLHAALKAQLSKRGDSIEQQVNGYQIDIVRGKLLIEIQTGNFGNLKTKLPKLLETYRIMLVYPIAETKWIVKQNKRGREISRRRSPKRGRLEHLFDELLSIPHLAAHPNFSLLVLLTQQEEIWRNDGKGSWRRKHWSIADHRLLEVFSSQLFENPRDYLNLLPAGLPTPFTHQQLAKSISAPVWTSTRMSYCLRKMGCLESVGKQGRAMLLAPRLAADRMAA
jgi:hypothetical protein